MNFLSHHYVAHAARADAPDVFYVANLLPDLLTEKRSGGRLRPGHLPQCPDAEVAAGVALHLAVDHAFHTSDAFSEACAEASALLRGGSFSAPPRRVFFLSHIFVEIALDGTLLARYAGLADDLYRRFTGDAVRESVRCAEAMLERSLPDLPQTLSRFAEVRYLDDYATVEGQAQSLHRICRRAGLPGFPSPHDRGVLASLLAAFQPGCIEYGRRLWVLPPI